jgi:hypothetical protein
MIVSLVLLVFLPVSLLFQASGRATSTPLPTPPPTPAPSFFEEKKKPAVTPTSAGTRLAPGAPTPTPTEPPRDPHLVAALEAEQGDGLERVAVWDDGTLILVNSYKGRATRTRKVLSPEEVDLVRKVSAEALVIPDLQQPERGVLAAGNTRRIHIEVTDPNGVVRTWAFDDMTQLPLPVGRARGALEDMRSRFFREDPKDTAWDASKVKTGDLLKRRTDGSWFRVMRDDSFESNLEIAEAGGDISMRLFVVREEIPKLFEDPAKAPAPTPRPGR